MNKKCALYFPIYFHVSNVVYNAYICMYVKCKVKCKTSVCISFHLLQVTCPSMCVERKLL